MCVYAFVVCVVLCSGVGLAKSWSLVQGVLPSAKIITEVNKGQGPEWAGRAIEKKIKTWG
jgi:hypothetical protein